MVDETTNTDVNETADGAGQQDNAGEIKFTPEQQKHIDKLIAERLERAKRKAEDDRKAELEKAAAEAEKQRLAEQGQYKELAEKAQARVTELETQLEELATLKERLPKLEGALQSQLATAKKDLPKHLLELLEKQDIIEQLEYLASHAEELRKPMPGVPATPNPATPQPLTDEERRKRAASIRQYA